MPITLTSRIAAQVFSNRKLADSWVMYFPMVARSTPKKSATTAPIRLNTVATRKALNKNGRALGMRKANNVLKSLAAYDLINSSARGSTCVKPRTVLINTGKNTITATIAIHEKGLLGPNQLNRIGEKAIIGTELAAIANGIIASR